MRHIFLPLLSTLLSLAACGSSTSKTAAEGAPDIKTDIRVPHFDADSAYAYVAAQTAFGPRVPGTQPHRQCAAWLADNLRRLGAANVTVDSAELRAYNGDRLAAFNITGSFNPSAQRRILLLAHWDSRPWADHDPDPANRMKPIDGANDGASGVAVILETGRQLAAQTPGVGVDVLFVDAEDYGRREGDGADSPDEESWALGTQYWVENPTLDLEKIRYAVLLDMVGGKDAVFAREPFSDANAKAVVDKMWDAAAKAGYADRFVHRQGVPVLDDHVYLLKAGIPAIDIIECANPKTGAFNPTWHTMADNIDNIDRETLRAAGQSVLQLIYSE